MHKNPIIIVISLLLGSQNALSAEEPGDCRDIDRAIGSAALLDRRLAKLFAEANLVNSIILDQQEKPDGYWLYFSREGGIRNSELVALDATYNEYWQNTFANLIEVLQILLQTPKYGTLK